VPKRVFITAAEVSGDQHAAALIKSLKQLDPTLIIEGHGGPLMRAAGATIHHETVKKAAMGWRGDQSRGDQRAAARPSWKAETTAWNASGCSLNGKLKY